MADPPETQELVAKARTGMYGNAEEARAGEEAVAAMAARIEQLEAELDHFRARFGEMVADPLTELRMRLQR